MERRLLQRELSSGLYSLPAFLLSKVLTSAPLEVAQVLIAGGAFYAATGLQAGALHAGRALALLCLSAVSASTLGQLIGVLTPSLHVAFPALTGVLTLELAFCGYIVQRVPVW